MQLRKRFHDFHDWLDAKLHPVTLPVKRTLAGDVSDWLRNLLLGGMKAFVAWLLKIK
jgi:hypothetical protein